MYNRQWRAWQSAEYDEARLLWCRESFNRENPEALFTLADAALGKAGKGKETAEAVYNMEKAAKLGHAQAALAMGELFQCRQPYPTSRSLAMEPIGGCLNGSPAEQRRGSSLPKTFTVPTTSGCIFRRFGSRTGATRSILM